ncbi:DNA-dependent RNA polymerase auxiliary subunit epsilon [Evansella vedderi]|uniref:DNA-directed RNA polymerase subunit epsilon n=1 Tax=Evansella vedderi TaxID=38282 RepID=A0ABT9ZT13_9BACI|nr:DNA-directed RNA polymerase subunit epsilon [Evansella vedderi]MDQ0253887.1 DNA-dependent RNA polymerase auxiliary subunit epsilon [Evansella vedderi]
MIYKVFYQPSFTEVPVREKTESIYLKAESEEDVRKKLANRKYNIEFITVLEGEALAYEQQNENFKLETV